MTRFLRTLVLLAVAVAVVAPNAFAYKIGKTNLPPDGTVGSSYSYQFELVGGTGPHHLKVIVGGLPTGLALSDEGLLSGTPKSSGTWSFWLEAQDANGALTQTQFTIGIASKLTVTTGILPGSTIGVPYSTPLTASGGSVDSWSVSSGSLPPGFALGKNGVLTGTGTSEGSWGFTVKATSGAKSDTKSLTLKVVAPLGVSIAAIPPAVVGSPFATKLQASGGIGSYTFRLASGTLPAGLALDPSTGIISGTPKTPGNYAISLAVSASGGGEAVQTMPLKVTPRLGFVTTTLPKARVGKTYTGRIMIKGGVGAVMLSSTSSFPAGVRLNAETGRFSGRPLRPGTYRVTVKALDSFGGTATKRFTIVVTR